MRNLTYFKDSGILSIYESKLKRVLISLMYGWKKQMRYYATALFERILYYRVNRLIWSIL